MCVYVCACMMLGDGIYSFATNNIIIIIMRSKRKKKNYDVEGEREMLTVECVQNDCQNEAMTALKFIRSHDDVQY